MGLPVKVDLPIQDQVEIDRVLAISSGQRSAAEAAFLTARDAYLNNEINTRDASNNILIAKGKTIPTDGDTGFSSGATFISKVTNLEYINTGSATSCAFRPLFPTVDPGATALAKTANYPVVAADMNKILTNTGAAGLVVFTLPLVASVAGQAIRFHLFAAQNVRLLPQTGEAIALDSSAVVTKYLDLASVIGNYAVVISDGSKWLVTDYSGVVTKEP